MLHSHLQMTSAVLWQVQTPQQLGLSCCWCLWIYALLVVILHVRHQSRLLHWLICFQFHILCLVISPESNTYIHGLENWCNHVENQCINNWCNNIYEHKFKLLGSWQAEGSVLEHFVKLWRVSPNCCRDHLGSNTDGSKSEEHFRMFTLIKSTYLLYGSII